MSNTYNTCMTSKTFNLSLPSELVSIIDTQAKLEYTTRSEYIKRSVLATLKEKGVLIEYEKHRSPEEARRAQLKEFLDAYSEDTFEDDLD